MRLFKRERFFLRCIAFAVSAGVLMSLLAGCASGFSPPAEATTEQAEDRNSGDKNTEELFSSGLNEDGKLKDINPKDYIEKPADYKNLNIPKDKWKIRSEDVDEQIKAIMTEYSETKEVKKRKIKKGDVVRLSYEVLVDGEVLPGETMTDFDLVIGSGVFEELEEGLKKKKPGKIEIPFTLPDPYENDESLSGKEAVIRADVDCIVVTKTPELTDEFVREHFKETYGASTVKEFKKAVRKKMRTAKRGNLAMQAVLKGSKMKEIPRELTDACVDRYIAQEKNRAGQYGMDFEQYLRRSHYANEKAMRKAVRKSCKEEATLYILIDYIASEEGITVSEADLSLLSYGDLTVDKLREYYPDAYLCRQALNLKVRDKVVDLNW